MTLATTTALQLPRAQWAGHPNYPRQVLLLGAHQNFRQLSRALIRWTEDGAAIDEVMEVFGAWKRAMRGHEAYEEHKLYPYLEARWPLSCADLRDGHEALAAEDRRVRAAAEAGDRGALQDALRAHDRVLDAHLDDEEDRVIPALLALAPAEFDAYYDGDITSLLANLRQNG